LGTAHVSEDVQRRLAYRESAPSTGVLPVKRFSPTKKWWMEPAGVVIPSVLKEMDQWFFKITRYAEELLQSLKKLNHWPDRVKINARALDRKVRRR